MAERNDEFFRILEEMVDIPNRFRDIPNDEYPQAAPSDHKWYEQFELGPSEILQDYVKDRLKKFPEDLKRENEKLGRTLDRLSDPNIPVEEKTERLLHLIAMKKMGHAYHPGMLDAYVGQVRDPDEPVDYFKLREIFGRDD